MYFAEEMSSKGNFCTETADQRRTDKAAYPINAMGKTKALEESVAIAKSRYSGKTKICCTRYGNVMCSRGSVIPLWIDQIKAGNPITVIYDGILDPQTCKRRAGIRI